MADYFLLTTCKNAVTFIILIL